MHARIYCEVVLRCKAAAGGRCLAQSESVPKSPVAGLSCQWHEAMLPGVATCLAAQSPGCMWQPAKGLLHGAFEKGARAP